MAPRLQAIEAVYHCGLEYLCLKYLLESVFSCWTLDFCGDCEDLIEKFHN